MKLQKGDWVHILHYHAIGQVYATTHKQVKLKYFGLLDKGSVTKLPKPIQRLLNAYYLILRFDETKKENQL